MKQQPCEIVSKEELVAYADGELPADEVERIAEHVSACPDCKLVIEALERSLQVTQAIWQTAQAQWPETHPSDKLRRSFKKPAAIAASILLILGLGAAWRLLSEPRERAHVIDEEERLAELKLKIADSGDAARLLAAAELLSRYPAAQSGLEQRYRHIVETYPETAAAGRATLRTQQFK